MINAEKYRDKLLKFIEDRDGGSFSFSKGEEGKFWQCGGRSCSECGMTKEGYNCSLSRLKWLLSEYKEPIKLSRLEYEILKYLSKIHTHIARDSDDSLHAYRIAPIKERSSWEVSSEEIYLDGCADVYEDLFKFIKWEDKEPRVIKDILNNCEVIEDA